MNGDSTDAPPEQNGLSPEHAGDDRSIEKGGEVEKGRDQFTDLKIQQEVGEEEGLRPKLAEGFYEIESVRRKRVRKVLAFCVFLMVLFVVFFFVLLCNL